MSLRLGKSLASVLQLISANVAVKVLGLAMVAFYARYLTKEDLSILPIYALVGSLSVVFFGFGIRPTMLRAVPSRLKDDPPAASALLHTSSAMLFAGALLFAVLAFIFAEPMAAWLFRQDGRADMMRYIAIGGFFVAARDILDYLLWVAERFDRISLVRTVGAVTRAVLGGVFVLLWGVKGLAFSLVLTDLMATVMAAIYALPLFRLRPTKWYPAGKLLRISAPFYFESFLVYFRGKGDSWLIAGALGPEAISTYYVAQRLPMLVTMIRGSIDNVITTQISSRAGKAEDIADYLPRLFNLISHAMLPSILMIAAISPMTILVVAGRDYAGAVVPGIILVLVQLVHLYVAPVSRALFVTRRPLVRVVATAFESVVMLACLALLARPFKEVGVTVSLFIAAVAAYVASDYLLRRKIVFRFPLGQFLRSLVAGLAMAVVTLALQYSGLSLLGTPLYALIGMVVFVLIVSGTNSRDYYATLNTVSPVRLSDPVRWILRGGRSAG